jgi:hypothetical protein
MLAHFAQARVGGRVSKSYPRTGPYVHDGSRWIFVKHAIDSASFVRTHRVTLTRLPRTSSAGRTRVRAAWRFDAAVVADFHSTGRSAPRFADGSVARFCARFQ